MQSAQPRRLPAFEPLKTMRFYFLLHGYGSGRASTPAADFKLRVVSLNVLTSNDDHDAVIDLVTAHHRT
jgi:hypothetical protein